MRFSAYGLTQLRWLQALVMLCGLWITSAAWADPADAADPRVIALANSLGNSPVAIYQYVRDNVGLEIYAGSLRGARGTLASKAGNPLDRASLLIALLKAANPAIEARYAQGMLSSTDATALVSRMFGDPSRIIGCDNPAPAFNANTLIAEAQNHTWVEYRVGPSGAYTALDTAFTGAAVNQTFATATQTFTSIPLSLRHTARIRLEVETFTQAAAAFGLAIGTNIVLDRTFESADLVDKPVTVSHFTNAFSPPAIAIGATQNTYSPYLTVGDSQSALVNYQVIRGIDYSEIITNFPLGNILVTGIFVIVDITDAAGQTQSYRRPMLDRIGYATRVSGGPVSVDPLSLTRPAVGELDLMTISIAPSRQALDDFSARKSRLQTLQAQLAILTPLVQGLPPPGLRDASQEAIARDGVNTSRFAMIASHEIALASFLGAADRQVDEQSLRTLVKAYIVSPRVTIAQTRLKNDALVTSMDIRKNDLRVMPLPGISVLNGRNFERNRGLGESVLEGQVLSSLTGDPDRSVSSVLSNQTDAARYRPVTSVNLAVLDSLNLSAEAKYRIEDAVRAGRVVLTPIDPVTVSGTPVTAWLETDPSTGYTISTLEDGSHGAFVEYVFAVSASISSSQASVFGQLIGRVNAVGVFGIALTSAILDSIVQQRPFSDLGQQLRNTLAPILKGVMQSIKAELDLMGLLQIELEGPGGIVKEMVTGLIEGLDDMTKMFAGENGDPPLPRLLFSSAVPALPAPQPPGTTAGLSITAAIDNRFTLPFAGSEFASVYLVKAVNTGPVADTFRFGSSGGGAGLSVTDVRYVWPVVRIAAGATFEFHVCMAPNLAVPPAGTTAGIDISGTSTTAPLVTTTFSGTFTTPASTALSMRVLPNPQAALPGATLPLTLTLDSRGNQATTVMLTTQSSAGLTVTGVPASVTLAAGESRSFPISAAVSSGATPGIDLAAVISGNFGATVPARAYVTVSVTSAIAQCLAPSSIAAARIGRDNLAAALGAMANDVDALAAQPASDTRRQEVLTKIDTAIAQLNAPFLTALVPALTAARATLAAASTASVGTALANLDTQFCALRAALDAAYNNAFRVYLSPAIATALPNQSTRVNVNIYNDTANPRAVNLSIAGVPAGVTATFNATRVVVPANYRTNASLPEAYVTFSNSGAAQAFEYQLIVTPEDDPGSTKSTTGQFSVRPEIVRVVDVSLSPAYGAAGTSFTPTVRLLSAVNDVRVINLRHQVKNRNGTAMTFPSGVTTVSFAPGDNVLTTAMTPFATTGFPDGPYTVEVIATDATDTPIPGATGVGTLFVGQPFAANLSITPSVLLPGNSTVNVALNLDHSLVAQQSLTLRSTLAMAASPISFAQNGNFLYVCQSTAVTIVDVSNPDSPVNVGSFASAVLTNGAASGYNNVNCSAYNGRLIVGFDQRVPDRSGYQTLAVYDISGANATSPVLLSPVPVDTGKRFGSALQFVGTDAYMTTALFVYNPFSNFIFEQHGNLLKFDFSSPNSPTLTGGLFPAGAGNPPENQSETGGPHYVLGTTPHSSTRALLATTSGISDFSNGVGRLLTVDTSQLASNCPGLSNPCVLSTLDIPQARLLLGVAHQGSAAVATGDTQGQYDLNSGYTGNLTLSAINLANPSAPVLSSTVVTPLVHNETSACNPATRKGYSSMRALTNNYYAIGAYNAASCTWVLVLIDANDPLNLRYIPYDVPDTIRSFVLNGNLLYAITASSVLVFDYTAITGPSVTATVVVPKNTGVTLVPNSFNLAPSSIGSTASSDTYTWLQPSVTPITWQASVSNVQPGSGRVIANGGSVAFTLPALGSGSLPLAPAVATANHIIAVSASTPPLVAVGAPATYVVSLTNPSVTGPITYTLSTEGIPASWVKTLAPGLTVAAGTTATTPLVVQSPIGQSGGAIDFRVVAVAGTASDAAVTTLNNYYNPDLGSDPSSAVGNSVFSVTPNPATGAKASTTTVTVRVTNTGTLVEEIALSNDTLPNGWSTIIPSPSAFVAPGESYDFKVSVAIPPPPNAVAGTYALTFNLDSRYQGRRTVSASVNVLDAGVTLSVSPNLGTPSTPFVATLTNLSGSSDTFDLLAAGPLGPAVTPGSSVLTLAAGASTSINLTVGNASAFARPGNSSFELLATSRTAPSAFSRTSASVAVAAGPSVNVIAQPSSVVIGALPFVKPVTITIKNTGNVEDRFAVSIVGTSGPLTAQLVDASSGLSVNSIGAITIPAFSSAAVQLNATVSANSTATVTVRATSLTSALVQASATVSFGVAPTCSLDIDGDGAALALTDGLLIVRHLLGLGNAALVAGAYNPAGSYGNLTDISSRLATLSSNNWLDIDGNGTTQAATDGVLLLRTLFGLTGTAVTDNALGAEPRARADWTAIRSYLNNTCGLGLP
jgi:hypothetical protein